MKNTKMDDPSTSIADAIMRINRGSSNTMATSTPTKRSNPYIDDEPVDVKKCKIEQPSVNQSAHQTKQYFPIASLKPTFSCPAIKGKLTEVSEWLISQSLAKFLVFRLRDESGEIKGIAFDPLSEDFHNNFKLGATVILEKTKVEKEGNKPECYKLVVNRFSLIKIEDISPVPPKPVRKMIRDVLDNSNERDVIDILGILEDVTEMERNSMREIRIIDESEANIVLTLWDKAAKNFNAPLGSVIAAYRVAVRIFNSAKVLRTCHLSKLLVDPPIDETQRLKQWYSEWTAAANACLNKNSAIIENTVQRTNNSFIDNRKTEIVGCFASTSTSVLQGNYISIEAALKLPAGALIDIMGFLKSQEPPVQQQTKSGRLRWMKTLMLTDGNNCAIEMAVWGDEVKDCGIPLNSAITAKNVGVRDFGNTKTLSCLWTNLQIERNDAQAAGLRISIPNNSTTNEMENSVIAGSSISPRNFSHRGNITSIKEINDIANAGSKHNIVALVTKCEPPTEQQTKSGNSSWMRVVMLMDDEDSEIEMAVWGNEVKIHDIPINSIILARNVTVRDFNDGKTLTCLWVHLQIGPNVPQITRLKKLIPKNSTINEMESSFIAGSSNAAANYLHCNGITSIKEINEVLTSGSKCNIVALVTKCGQPEEQQTKAGNKSWMRIVMLSDDEDSEIEMTVWGGSVTIKDIPLHSVIMARNVTVRDFNNKKTLNCLWAQLQIEPIVPEVARLRKLIRNNSTANEMENPVIARSSKSSNTSSLCQKITSIKEIKVIATAGSRYNIVALVTKCGPPEEQKTKAGKRTWMRVVMLMDDEDSEIEMAVWGDAVKDNDIPLRSVIMARNVTVRDFNNEKTFSCLWMHLQIDPNVPQVARLKNLIPKSPRIEEMESSFIAGSSKSTDNYSHCNGITSIKKINEVATSESKYDIVALVTKCGPPTEQQTKTGKSTWMRVVMLIDDEDSEIEMAIWGNEVKNKDIPPHSVIMARNVSVRDFHDSKTLTCLWMHLQIEPNVPQSSRLKKLIPKSSVTDKTKIAGSSKTHDNFLNWKNITSIKEIKGITTAGSKYDIVALVTECRLPEEQETKAGKRMWMRVVMLMDDVDTKIEMAVWGNEVQNNDIPLHSVIMARNVLVRDFNNEKTLSCIWSHLHINPAVPQAKRLKELIATKNDRNSESQERFAEEQIQFTPIREIISGETQQSTCNIVGIVIELKSPETQSSQAENGSFKKVVIVSDEPNSKMELTVWGDEGEIPLHSVIIAQNVEIQESNNDKTLNCLWTDLKINPDVPEADKLAKIFANHRYAARERDDSHDFDSFEKILEETGHISKWNLIGLVKKTEPSMQLDSSPEGNYWFTKVKLKDANGKLIELVIWSNESLESAIALDSVLAAKGAEARMANDRVALGVFWDQITIDPDVPEAQRLKQVRKKEWNSRWPDFREYVDVEIEDYTPIDLILRRNKPGDCINTIGLVVEVNPPTEWKNASGNTYYIKKCILRGRNGSQIKLTVFTNPSRAFEIPLNCVIAVKDATCNHTENEKELMLHCRFDNVEFDIDIPESEGFKEAALNTLVRFECPEDQDPNNFTTIKEIKETRPLGSTLNVLGLVVDVIKRRTKQCGNRTFTVRVTLMDVDSELITLIIKKTPKTDNCIKVHSVIAASDATLRQCGDDKVLWCLRSSVQINPMISEAEESKLNKLKREKTSFTKGFMPFKTILHDRSLVDCNVDIIGQVVEILPADAIPDAFVKTCFERTFILRNEIDIKLVIQGSNDHNSSNDENAISLNTIIAAKGALIKIKEKEILLSVKSSEVTINPQISESDRGAKSLCIVPIKRILEVSKVGDKLGVLAVVRNPPRKVFGFSAVDNSSDDSEEENRKMSKSESGSESAELIDASGESIIMTMPFSVANDLRNNREKTVAIQARNVQVCKYESGLELVCTSRASRVDINPATKEAKELLKWYDLFCKKENDEKKNEEQRELPVVSINSVLENCADETRTSIMGIMITSKMYKITESGMRFETRIIQIIDESEEVINLLLWNLAAKNFDVPLYSIILVWNFRVYSEGEIKWGDFGPETEYKVITAVGKYQETAQRLESWFAKYCARSQNLTCSDDSNNGDEKLIALSNRIKVPKNAMSQMSKDIKMEETTAVLSNDIKILKSPTVLSNDTEMFEIPTVLSNDIKMEKIPTVFPNNSEMLKSPTLYPNDIEMVKSPTALPKDTKMVKSPTLVSNFDIQIVESPIILPNDIEMVEGPTVLSEESSQKISEKSGIFFGNNCCLSQKNERVLGSLNDNDVIESDSASPDIFADC